MLRTWINAGKLRRWLGRPAQDCPDIIAKIWAIFEKEFNGEPTTSRTPLDGEQDDYDESVWLGSEVSTPPNLQALCPSPRVRVRARIQVGDVVLARYSSNPGDSMILFHPAGDTSVPAVPGCIEEIFVSEDKWVFAVRRHLSSAPDVIDPFRHYPYFDAKLYSTNQAKTLELVKTDWVTVQFASWQMSPEHVVVVAMHRVRTPRVSLYASY